MNTNAVRYSIVYDESGLTKLELARKLAKELSMRLLYDDTKLGESERHIFLYAKKWYERTDVIDDLKRILGIRS